MKASGRSMLKRMTVPGGALIAIYAGSKPASVVVGSFFFNDTATTEIYTLSLHDALPINRSARPRAAGRWRRDGPRDRPADDDDSVRRRSAAGGRGVGDAGHDPERRQR